MALSLTFGRQLALHAWDSSPFLRLRLVLIASSISSFALSSVAQIARLPRLSRFNRFLSSISSWMESRVTNLSEQTRTVSAKLLASFKQHSVAKLVSTWIRLTSSSSQWIDYPWALLQQDKLTRWRLSSRIWPRVRLAKSDQHPIWLNGSTEASTLKLSLRLSSMSLVI